MVRLPAGRDPDAVVAEMKGKFPALRLSFETVEERRRNLGQALEHLDAFLSLVGFVALVLGGIGVSSALHAYIREKIPTVAVLRCLGASARPELCRVRGPGARARDRRGAAPAGRSAWPSRWAFPRSPGECSPST